MVVPTDTPVSKPLVEPIVAIDVLLLLHVPPPAASVSVVVAPTQTLKAPPMVGGVELMGMVVVVLQPVVGSVYVIVVLPAVLPVTIPVVDPIDAIAALLLVQTPPVVGSVSVRVCPTQRGAAPAIAAGNGFTVSVRVVKQPVVVDV